MVGKQVLTHTAVFAATTLVKCCRYHILASHGLTLQHRCCRLSRDRASRLHGWTRALDRDFRLKAGRFEGNHETILLCSGVQVQRHKTGPKAVQTPTPGCKHWDWPITWRS